MKNIISSTLFVFLLVVTGCQSEATVQELMDSEVVRREVYATIMDNPEMRQEMMQRMREHPEGGMMMGEGDMMGRGHMMSDTTRMMQHMMQQMRQQGMLDEACYQQMMQNMGNRTQ